MHARHAKRLKVVRSLAVISFLFAYAIAASAYTVVMRGGKRIEIPSEFAVTNSTLTYEVSPGIQVTVATAAIDIPATEKANNELPGSFVRRIRSGPSAKSEVKISAPSGPTKTITNRDLEVTAQRRRDSELAYEKRRKELGLPSVAESRRQAAAESAAIAVDLEKTQAANRESEAYWRGRASALRTEMSALDAELNYVRLQLDNPVYPADVSLFPSLITVGSFGSFNRRSFYGGHPSFGGHRSGVFLSPRNGLQIQARVGFGGAARGQVFANRSRFPRSIGGALLLPGYGVPIGSITMPFDLSERNELITRFNELGAARARLNARWRELEDEARRAGAPPGWLRE
ncbi:MAG TPA: hypothetical protein VIW64_17185 [Pyrinomonadaceae bacterium]|jgi:hypothetical protein